MNAHAQCIANAERDLGPLVEKQKADLLLDNFAEIRGFEAALEIVQSLPKPQLFPFGGSQFSAYDPDRFDVCSAPECKCRQHRNNVVGLGSTGEEALADFWEQWDNA